MSYRDFANQANINYGANPPQYSNVPPPYVQSPSPYPINYINQPAYPVQQTNQPPPQNVVNHPTNIIPQKKMSTTVTALLASTNYHQKSRVQLDVQTVLTQYSTLSLSIC